MVPVRIQGVTYNTNNVSSTQNLASHIHRVFHENPNSPDLRDTFRSLGGLRRSDFRDAAEEDRTEAIDDLLRGMINANSGYKEQVRTQARTRGQSASVRIYVDGRELPMGWRHHGTPGGDVQEKQEKAKADKQSARVDAEGFERTIGKKEAKEIGASVDDAESKIIALVDDALGLHDFVSELHAAQHDVYIRFVSFLGACDACKTRIQRLLERIQAQVPAGVRIHVSFFYQVEPHQKQRKRVTTTYGWPGDEATAQRGYGGYYIHDFAPVTGTWVAPQAAASVTTTTTSAAAAAAVHHTS